MKGVVVAGTASGVGKTVASLAVCRALAQEGRTIQPAKAGPDFIDPSHHAAVTGQPSRTLDPWLQGEGGVVRNYWRGTGDVCVVEGMMGLYDGDTSTADVAAALDLPVVLVVDASAGMQSVAATALGFREYASHTGQAVDVAGLLATRCHTGRHASGVREALPDGLRWLGHLPPREELTIPARHLGLHLGEEAPLADEALDAAAETIDAGAILDVARVPPRPGEETEPSASGAANPADARPRVAVARDEAFRFVYPATLERLSERAEVVTFAPTAGDDLPPCDGVYVPGGYPELHAEALSASPALATLADLAVDGLPVLGECGGLMALAESLTTAGEPGVCGDGPDDGAGRAERTYEMAGVLPAELRMHDRHQALDHVELRAREDALTARRGQRLRGHEFHYSSARPASDARFAFDVERGTGIDDGHDGLTEYRTLGTYAHVHAESGAFDRFLDQL